ncbi:MAG: methylenetetrahydrofolate--tRNA-(uracil(54)-C(5))-methyltransferase (FADH(2)-oxidizing) TrmFO [Christensenellaceae bacterium]|nr:methylenetetrahydrofolate--tRNA-(uracil(54)-C(5))-methyltransferase (FADH(2)-oxidizing) TrmFO [Christensenellaceae bacterium]
MITVIGAGLAGCEAAHQIAKKGIQVRLIEMKPKKKSPAHTSDGFAELVCSNSLRAAAITNAVGLMKEEMRRLDSLIMEAADKTSVAAGGSLAVDRHLFSEYITKAIRNNPLIEVEEREVDSLSEIEGICVVATGPLTSGGLYDEVGRLTGDKLHFFDAAAPIVSRESINMEKVFFASRWGKGDADYLNCPMTKEEYDAFYQALISAECAELAGFEDDSVFEGCLPVEVMAKRGYETLLYGPLKPVGLFDEEGKKSYAVVQLRREDAEGTMFNLVGFQTHLKFPEQKRVFALIPGLEKLEIVRYGVMHRNTYINSPGILDRNYRLIKNNNIFFAGQMTGVEGYIESAASGLYAGLSAAAQAMEEELPFLSNKTTLGAMAEYISSWAGSDFQPMNINFGIMAPLEMRIRNKKEKNTKIAERALAEIDAFRSR